MTPIRIALLGCGTVGGGVIRLLRSHALAHAARVGAPIEVRRVLVRDRDKERVPDLPRSIVTTNPDEIFCDEAIDIVVEVMGGIDPARAYVERAIDAGRGVVTANKMLLALHGPALVERAAQRGVDLAFEGSVGGGIPIVRTLREALASDSIVEIAGIVNGTSNFVLTRMQREGATFEAALREAQELGYAEADPSLDVDGHDAAHKLVVLAMLAFGARVDHARVATEGIRTVEPIDHAFAARFGFAVKHLAIGRDHGDRGVELRVHPALLPSATPLANVGGVLNAIAIAGSALGPCLLSGRGAGDMPTAVSVVADLIDVARARRGGTAGLATRAIVLRDRPLTPMSDVECRFFLRFEVYDRAGVLARITGALGDAGVSIEQVVQLGGGDAGGKAVQVVMLTHAAREGAIQRALAAVAQADFAAAPPRLLRVHG